MDLKIKSYNYANIKAMVSKYILCKSWDQRNLFALVLVSYISGFLVARLFVILNPQSQFWYIGLHLHHYFLGLIFLIVAVGIPLYYRSVKNACISAIFYGTGLGIYVDEIGLQLTGGSVYWDPATLVIFTGLGLVFSVLALVSNRVTRESKDTTLLIEKNQSKIMNLRTWLRKISFGSVLISFLIVFSGARIFTVLFPHFQIWFFGYHLHHYYLGVIFLVIAGGLLYFNNGLKYETTGLLLFGSGVGLIINQVGELLTEGDYWFAATWFFFIVFGMIFLILFLQQRKIE